jgi:hypothetical protein
MRRRLLPLAALGRELAGVDLVVAGLLLSGPRA